MQHKQLEKSLCYTMSSLFEIKRLLCSSDRVAMLADVQAVLGACRVGRSRQLTQDLNYRRAGELQPLLLHPLGPDKDPQSRGIPPSVHALLTVTALLCTHFSECVQTRKVPLTPPSRHRLSRQQWRARCCSATPLWVAPLIDFMLVIASCWQLLPWSPLQWCMWG